MSRYGVVYVHRAGNVTFCHADSKSSATVSAGGATRMGTALRAYVVRIEAVERAPGTEVPVQKQDVSFVGLPVRFKVKRPGARRESRSRR